MLSAGYRQPTTEHKVKLELGHFCPMGNVCWGLPISPAETPLDLHCSSLRLFQLKSFFSFLSQSAFMSEAHSLPNHTPSHLYLSLVFPPINLLNFWFSSWHLLPPEPKLTQKSALSEYDHASFLMINVYMVHLVHPFTFYSVSLQLKCVSCRKHIGLGLVYNLAICFQFIPSVLLPFSFSVLAFFWVS